MPKPKAQKLLERSTRLARDAVRLDNSGDFRGALAAYFLCVDTLADFNKGEAAQQQPRTPRPLTLRAAQSLRIGCRSDGSTCAPWRPT